MFASQAVDDMILGSMGRGIAGFAEMSAAMGGLRPGETEVVDGVFVVVSPTTEKVWMGDRLREIDRYALQLSKQHCGDLTDIRGRLLWADGWGVNRRTVKTPPWMEPHVEVASGEVDRFVGLDWFSGMIEWFEERRAQK